MNVFSLFVYISFINIHSKGNVNAPRYLLIFIADDLNDQYAPFLSIVGLPVSYYLTENFTNLFSRTTGHISAKFGS